MPLSFRVTAATRQKLEAAALANGRSLSAEAEARLEQSFDHAAMMEELSKVVRERVAARLAAHEAWVEERLKIKK